MTTPRHRQSISSQQHTQHSPVNVGRAPGTAINPSKPPLLPKECGEVTASVASDTAVTGTLERLINKQSPDFWCLIKPEEQNPPATNKQGRGISTSFVNA